MDRITPPRHDLFGDAAALLGLAGPIVAAAAAGAHPEAELLAACVRFLRAEAEWRRLSKLESDIKDNVADLDNPSVALAAARAARQASSDDEYHAAMDPVLDPADPQTPEGPRSLA